MSPRRALRTSSALSRASAPADTNVLACWMSRMRDSTVLSATRRTAVTGRVWPRRCTRSMACSSTAAFHHVSSRKTWFARVRLRPVPPHLSDTRSTRGPPSPAKSARSAARFAADSDPEKTRAATSASSRAAFALARTPTNWLKTTTFSSAGTAATASSSARIFGPVDVASEVDAAAASTGAAAAADASEGETRSALTKGARQSGQPEEAYDVASFSEQTSQKWWPQPLRSLARAAGTSSRQTAHSKVPSSDAAWSWDSASRSFARSLSAASFVSARPPPPTDWSAARAAARRGAGTSDAPPAQTWRRRSRHSRIEEYDLSASSPRPSTAQRAVSKSAA
mmetsp:Transcript_26088/g.89103  ORF Transcript_26088/g.89103 Transcript_26088/m.89103 type:complete len:339 (-) Transcript_26088:658-1674(-)